MVDANMEVLQALANRNFGMDLNGAVKVASGLDMEMNGVSYALFGGETNANFENFKTLLGGRSASFPGVNGSYWQAADNAAFEIAGDIDIRLQVDSFTATGANSTMVSRWAASPNQVWEWRVSVGGANQWFWSTLGTDTSTIVQVGTLDTPGGHRLTMDVDDGAGNKVITHYRGGSLAQPLTQHDQDIIAGTTSIFTGSPAPLRVGARADAAGLSPYRGNISRMQLRNSAGTLVADFDTRFKAPGTTSFVDSVGVTWTAFGTAGIA